MTQDQLHKLIAQGEGQRLEFKESVAEIDRVIQTLSAFANTNPDGGCVLIGVGDRSKVKEVVIGKETTKQISDKIAALTDPVLYPEIEVVNRDYIELNGIAKRYSVVELNDLMNKGVLKQMGKRRATYYVLAHDFRKAGMLWKKTIYLRLKT